MMDPLSTRNTHTPRVRRIRVWGAIAALATMTILTTGGCGGSDADAVFRQAALSNLRSGVGSIIDGLLDGVFAVLEIGDDPAAGG